MLKRLRVLTFLALATTGGCANVLYQQRYRPVEFTVQLSATRGTSCVSKLGVWFPNPEQAHLISENLKNGRFQMTLDGEPSLVEINSRGAARVVAEEYSRRVCEPRFLGLPRQRGLKSRPLFVAVIQDPSERGFTVVEVFDGRRAISYEVRSAQDGAEILVVLVGRPTVEATRGSEKDMVLVTIADEWSFDT